MKERFEKMTPEEKQKAIEGFRKRFSGETKKQGHEAGTSNE